MFRNFYIVQDGVEKGFLTYDEIVSSPADGAGALEQTPA